MPELPRGRARYPSSAIACLPRRVESVAAEAGVTELEASLAPPFAEHLAQPRLDERAKRRLVALGYRLGLLGKGVGDLDRGFHTANRVDPTVLPQQDAGPGSGLLRFGSTPRS